jgi:hypothetical protein
MRARSIPLVARRCAQIIAGLNMLLVLTGFSLELIYETHQVAYGTTILAVVYNVLAVLILSRHPRHIIGWLFLIMGFFLALGGFMNGLDALAPIYLSEAVHSLAIWIEHIVWIPAYLIPMTLVLQFFPDGHLSSRRWWPVTAAAILGMLGMMASYAFYPWPWEEGNIIDTYNPFGIPGSQGFFNLLLNISFFLIVIGILGSLVMVVARFRRAQGIQRAQMKWLVYTALFSLLSSLVVSIISGFENPVAQKIYISLPIFMAIAITIGISIAILRYRLFDIDLIIRRTVQYALLTGALGLVYFSSVVLLQSLLGQFAGEQSPAVIVISTLAIVVLFNPLRKRIQDFIDRRFYRKKYDSERALARFSATARDEVDLEVISAELLRVVEETFQPEFTSLWVQPISGPESTQIANEGQ